MSLILVINDFSCSTVAQHIVMESNNSKVSCPIKSTGCGMLGGFTFLTHLYVGFLLETHSQKYIMVVRE